jgi:hypothetical protein
MGHRSRLESTRINPFNVPVYRTRVHEGIVIYHSNAASRTLVDISDVVDVIYIHVVIHIRDLYDCNACVCNVNVLNIARTGPIPGDVNFSGPQREPANSAANSHSYTEASAADKCHQGRRVNRTYGHRSRNPAPPPASISPASIVERSKAPWLIFNPSPSPGPNIGPVPIPIGSPVTADSPWAPDVTVAIDVVPIAVFIQILVTGHLGRDVSRTAETVFAAVAIHSPTLEIILLVDSSYIVGKLISPGKASFLSFAQPIRVASSCDFSIATEHFGDGLISVFVYVDAIFAGLVNVEGQVGRINFKRIVLIEMPDAEEYRSH